MATAATTDSIRPTRPVSIDVVICTYNRARDLDRTVTALSRRSSTDGFGWSVTVVDNASTDETRSVIEAWIERGALPALRCALELYLSRQALSGGTTWTAALVQAAFTAGYLSAARNVARSTTEEQQNFIGAASRFLS